MDVILFKPGDTAIKGESTLEGHVDEIELHGYSHGVTMACTVDQSHTERTSGRSQHQDFTISKYFDLSSVKLHEYCNKAQSLKQCTILVGRNDNGAILPLVTYTLDEVLISSISVSGGGDRPQETVTLNYTQIKIEYQGQKTDASKGGTSSTTWGLKTNKAA